jgi:hypothetical protein
VTPTHPTHHQLWIAGDSAYQILYLGLQDANALCGANPHDETGKLLLRHAVSHHLTDQRTELLEEELVVIAFCVLVAPSAPTS